MLSELSVVGKWFQGDSKDGWNFDDVVFNDEAKNFFEKLPLDIVMSSHSAKIMVNGNSNHCYIPGQYFLYALKIQPLVTLLGKYMSTFEDVVKTLNPISAAADFDQLITSNTPNNTVINALDSFSRDNFVNVFKNEACRLGAKNILNEDKVKGKKFRGKEDFFRSFILKAIPVPDASSEMLGKLIYAFSQSPTVYDYLVDHFSQSVPYLLRSDNGDALLFMVLSSLAWEGKLDGIISSGARSCAWGTIVDAFLLSSTPVAGNASYMDKPIHYLVTGKKYVHMKKGLLVDSLTCDEVYEQISSLWPKTYIEQSNGEFYLKSSEYKKEAIERLSGGYNKIIYGAPGTGKSYRIFQEIEKERAKSFVTVFHPDTQYSDFVGTLKPRTHRDDHGNLSVTYQFRPGPFTNALIHAKKNPSEKVYLVIEEINRAPAAAVFGELFQLLDRDEKGSGIYEIDVTDPDMLEYINANTGEDDKALRLPSNLYLSATMNSSDQAVMPLDTAFKRRWSFEYLNIDFSAENVPQQQLQLFIKDGMYSIAWKDLADKVINALLKSFNVNEDRLIGPYFLDETELKDDFAARNALCGKLFIYLWDDVLRHKIQDRKRLFSEDVTTFGDLYCHFMERTPARTVFSDLAEELIKEHGTPVGTIDG
ncbi:McrB family protein [Yersinia enterocolitica]|nr:AAA family ATPase [Yersinia frederiksenii]EKN5070577.1 hypothetical protein [Yersinia enterocolitica]OWF74337.1 hypothetical protein B4902_06035 [Yersinia frederiksenii]HEB1855531.1 AAA family ATPase [Yersinia enterocolitica]HEF7232876.1 AAA family ATPase [Yersinia enterocolitica]HEI6900142.1 AAA family ATPase [Yersinia enterocolitica]